jgi:hypothetical protein
VTTAHQSGGKDTRQFGAQEAQPLAHRNPALQQEGTNLVDDASALADQPFAHPVQRLQVGWSAVLVATNFIVGRCTGRKAW